jgi:hypothetical protein
MLIHHSNQDEPEKSISRYYPCKSKCIRVSGDQYSRSTVDCSVCLPEISVQVVLRSIRCGLRRSEAQGGACTKYCFKNNTFISYNSFTLVN